MTDHEHCLAGTVRRVHRRILALAAIPALALMTTAVSAEWYQQYAWPLTEKAFDMHMFDADNALAFGINDNILRTTDGGLTWTQDDPGLPVEARGGDFGTVDFLNDTTAMAATIVGDINDIAAMTGYILKTTDGGANWEIQLGMPSSVLPDVAFRDDQVAIAVGVNFLTGETILTRTTDGGATWTEADTGLVGIIMNGVTFIDDTTAVAVGYDALNDSGVIVRTTDAGVTWTVVEDAPAPARLSDVVFRDASNGIAIGDFGSIVTTSDGGQTWTARTAGTDRHLYRAAYVDADRIILVGGDDFGAGVIAESSDGGQSWSVEESGFRLEGIAFHDENIGMAAGSGGELRKTTDGGQTWQTLTTRLSENGFRGVSFPSPMVGTGVGVDGMIYKTVDGGSHWFSQDSGTPHTLYDVSFHDENRGIAVGGHILSEGYAGVIIITDDGGETWVDRTPAGLPAHPYFGVSCTDADTCVTSAHCGMIAGTTDGGNSWELLRDPDCTNERRLENISMHESGAGVAVGRFTILTTDDGGETWISRANPDDPDNRPTDQVMNNVFQIDAQTALIAAGHQTDQGTILRTTDGGETWTVQRDDLPSRLYGIDFRDALNGVAVDLAGWMHYTDDGGVSWDTRRLGGNLYDVSLTGPESGVVVGYSRGGLVHLTNGGPTFPIMLKPDRAVICEPQDGADTIPVQVTVNSVLGYQGTVNLATGVEPTGISSTLSTTTADAPEALQWTINAASGVSSGHHFLDLIGDDGDHSQVGSFRLDVIDGTQTPGAVAPADGAIDVELSPDFAWGGVASVSEYRFQLARDAQFNDIVFEADVAGTAITPDVELDLGSEYFWRVRVAQNSCAEAWSDAAGFVTDGWPVVEVAPAALEFSVTAGSSDAAALTVANIGVEALDWNIDTAESPAAGTPPHTPATPAAAFGASPLEAGAINGAPIHAALLTGGRGDARGCADVPGVIAHDDGIVDNAYSGEPEADAQIAFVDLFTPSFYPSMFTSVCLAFVTTGADTMDVEVVIFDDDGADGGPGTELGTVPTRLAGLPGWPSPEPVWAEIDISELGIVVDAGNVYIGARWEPVIPGPFLAADESTANPAGFAGGYWDGGEEGWEPLIGEFASYRSMFVRAIENPGGCYTPGELSWLTITPATGSTPEGGDTAVEVAVDATGLAPGDYQVNLCINSNDPGQPLAIVPVNLTVEEGPPVDAIFGDRFQL